MKTFQPFVSYVRVSYKNPYRYTYNLTRNIFVQWYSGPDLQSWIFGKYQDQWPRASNWRPFFFIF